jgi:predicted RNase H-like nuclease (RuvC/YqgF family)
MPRLKSLGWQEFSNRTARFPINDNAVVFVDDPFSFSEQTIAELRSKHATILSAKEAKSNPLNSQGLVLLNVSDIHIELHPTIAVVKKVDIDRKRKEKSLLYDIVEKYQKEREHTG